MCNNVFDNHLFKKITTNTSEGDGAVVLWIASRSFFVHTDEAWVTLQFLAHHQIVNNSYICVSIGEISEASSFSRRGFSSSYPAALVGLRFFKSFSTQIQLMFKSGIAEYELAG